MATYTENYNLKKPSTTDQVNIEDLNGNADIIDAALAGKADTTDVSAKYTKPATGIPATDLAAGVQTSLGKADTAIQASEKGAVNGVATLDGAGKVPASQLPSYVDDVIEGYYYNGAFYSDSAHTTPITPETGKIYVDLDSSKSYRFSGSAYYRIDEVTVDNTPTAGSSNPVSSGGAYSALAGKVDKVAGKGLSTLDFTVADRQAISNAYVKPTAGVPKTDLSQDVQTSLDKADNSLQAALDETLTVQGAAADAKATGEAIGDVKSYFEDNDINLSNTYKDSMVIETMWEQGSLSSGVETDRSTRIRTPYIYIDNYESITITSESGFYFEVDFYNSSKSYTSYLGWSNEKTFDKSSGTYVRLILKKSNDADIIPSEANGNIIIIGSPSLAKRFRDVAKISTYEKTNLQDESAWELGSIMSTGEESSTNTRIRSTFKSVLSGDVVYFLFNQDINSPYYFLEVIAYDSNFNVLGASDWKDEMVILQHDGYIRLNARKRDNSAISSADLSDMVSKIYFNYQPINMDKEFSDGDTIKAINHRGWHEAPENTLIAYQQSFNHGFKYVETDIRFTSDNVIVCLHDATINRTARNMDGTEISGTVNINSITYSEALSYDFGIWKGEEYAGTKIPALSEFLTLCRNLNLRPYIDIGSEPEPSKAQIQSIVDAVTDAGLSGKATYLCGVLKFGTWIVEKDPCARIGLVTSLNERYCKYCYTYLTGKNTAFMDTQNSNVDSASIALLKQYSLPLEIWTINDTNVIDEMSDYVSGVTSDSINVNQYLEKQAFITPDAVLNRATNIIGGYIRKGNVIYVNLKYQSEYSATNSPAMMELFPHPKGTDVVLQCVKSNNGINSNIDEVVGCAIQEDRLYQKTVENGATYYVTGCYVTD